VLFGKYDGEPGGEIVVRGKTASGPFEKAITVGKMAPSADHAALRLLWARHRITRLSDLNLLKPEDSRIKEVTDLGLKYSIMTQYTSFVAVDKLKRADGTLETVKQPLPLPEGVSDLAVGHPQATAGGTILPRLGAGPAPPSRVPGERGRSESTPGRHRADAKSVREQPLQIPDEEGKTGTAQLRITVEEVRGGLDRIALGNAIQRAIKQLRSCCPRKPGRSPDTGKELVLRIHVDGKGAVTAVEWLSSMGTDSAALECLKKGLLGITISPAGRGGGEAVIKVVCPFGS
jgi:Ca-activated chloride channel family protein